MSTPISLQGIASRQVETLPIPIVSPSLRTTFGQNADSIASQGPTESCITRFFKSIFALLSSIWDRITGCCFSKAEQIPSNAGVVSESPTPHLQPLVPQSPSTPQTATPISPATVVTTPSPAPQPTPVITQPRVTVPTPPTPPAPQVTTTPSSAPQPTSPAPVSSTPVASPQKTNSLLEPDPKIYKEFDDLVTGHLSFYRQVIVKAPDQKVKCDLFKRALESIFDEEYTEEDLNNPFTMLLSYAKTVGQREQGNSDPLALVPHFTESILVVQKAVEKTIQFAEELLPNFIDELRKECLSPESYVQDRIYRKLTLIFEASRSFKRVAQGIPHLQTGTVSPGLQPGEIHPLTTLGKTWMDLAIFYHQSCPHKG